MTVLRKGLVFTSIALLAAFTPSTAYASETKQYQPGDAVPTSVDPDGFLPQVSNSGFGFFAASTPAASCVAVQPSDGNVKVTNNCANRVGIKVLIAFGSDSECIFLEPNATHDHSYGSWWNQKARFDGVVSC